MPNWAEHSDDEWVEALYVPLADREQVKANRQSFLKGRQEEEIRLEEEAESRRRHTSKKSKKELTPDAIRLAKEGAEFVVRLV